MSNNENRLARIAPTPSGYLHEGNVANFLLNARLAGEEGGLLLRIDDLDRSRFREVYLEDIFRVLNHLGIHWTEGPRSPQDFHAHWSQRFRMPKYRKALAELRGHPLIFACPCSRRELRQGEHAHQCLSGKIPLDTEGVAWRVNTRDLAIQMLPNTFGDAPFVVDLHRQAPDFVVRKKDGRPSYQIGSLVDDLHFGVTDVARGEDLLPSTAAQSVLAEWLGVAADFASINFVHHPLLRGVDGEKLSKSAGARGESLLEDAGFDLGPIQHWVDRLVEEKG